MKNLMSIRAFFGSHYTTCTSKSVANMCGSKCRPILLYGLEACPLTKTQVKSLNHAVSNSFRKIFNVMSDDIVYSCRYMFNCADIENILCTWKRIFLQKYCLLDDIVCALCRNQSNIELASWSAWQYVCIIPVADQCQAVGLAGCGHSKIARVRAYYLYCMCLAPLTSV